jgi:hypothetical protein
MMTSVNLTLTTDPDRLMIVGGSSEPSRDLSRVSWICPSWPPFTCASGSVTVARAGKKTGQWRPYLKGCVINDGAMKAIFQQVAAEPLILRAQECFITPFSGLSTYGGVKAQLNIAQFDSSCFSVAHPATPDQAPVSRDPCQRGSEDEWRNFLYIMYGNQVRAMTAATLFTSKAKLDCPTLFGP